MKDKIATQRFTEQRNMTQKLKFSGKATDYAKYRPSYSDEVIDGILQGLGDPNRLVAVDIGAGTGIASRQLADRGVKVIAVEPDLGMIQAAILHPRVEFRASPAEAVLLPDSVADLVTTFQAFHWFKFGASLREFQRILKPSGRLALIWYAWDAADPFTHRYMDLMSQASVQHSHKRKSSQSLIKQLRTQLRNLLPSRLQLLRTFCWIPGFKKVRRYDFRYEQSVDLSALIGWARSQSSIPMDGPVWQKFVNDLKILVGDPDTVHTLVYKVTVYIGTSRKR